MRWILVLSFIIFFAPFAGAEGDTQDGVHSSEFSSTVGYSLQTNGDHTSFNTPTDKSRVLKVLEELGMDEGHAATPAADAKANATN